MEQQQPNESSKLARLDTRDLVDKFCQKVTAIPKQDIIRSLAAKGTIVKYISPDIEKLKAVQQIIENISEIYYGVRPGQLTDTMLIALASEIIQKFEDITLEDIGYAYERYAVTPRSDWKAPTKEEYIKPLRMWWNQKLAIRYEFKKYRDEQAEKIEANQKRLLFIAESKRIYNDSVDALEWLGDIFNANAIAKDLLSVHLEPDIKSALWLQAKQKRYELVKASEQLDGLFNTELLSRTTVRIYSELIVLECIKNGIKI